MQGAQRGTRSQVSRVTPWAKGRCSTTETPGLPWPLLPSAARALFLSVATPDPCAPCFSTPDRVTERSFSPRLCSLEAVRLGAGLGCSEWQARSLQLSPSLLLPGAHAVSLQPWRSPEGVGVVLSVGETVPALLIRQENSWKNQIIECPNGSGVREVS